MQQSQPSSSYMYPSSPTPSVPLYDSGYSSYGYTSPSPYSLHYSTCPYANNESYYIPAQPYMPYCSPASETIQQIPQPFASSTPNQQSNVCLVPTIKNVQPKRRLQQQQPVMASPSFCPTRKRISDEAIERLNAFYEIKKRPTEAEKDRIAMECDITLAQVNTWFNNARSRRGDTNPKLAQKLLKQQIASLNNQVALLQQHHPESSPGHDSF
ncbi:unnamed protein product [Rotaria magnacalcarata]|uniref:Homeobox domain-containing protein n=1 Tax=Rotaria magnacalcarata TaxID=392030 RepID=A0A815C525_9BILA|nr:unnamed protein product [Rotaria magnacalcarata]CAF5028672.1 unnamed protein product [Rotaria magnacalcarata]